MEKAEKLTFPYLFAKNTLSFLKVFMQKISISAHLILFYLMGWAWERAQNSSY